MFHESTADSSPGLSPLLNIAHLFGRKKKDNIIWAIFLLGFKHLIELNRFFFHISQMILKKILYCCSE